MATAATKRRRVNAISPADEILGILGCVSEKIAEVVPLLREYAASMHGEMKNEIDVLEAKVRGARKQIDLAALSVKYAEDAK